ncbi:hypothetical protein ABTK03_20665, partial [Acinetobacter baumannii]
LAGGEVWRLPLARQDEDTENVISPETPEEPASPESTNNADDIIPWRNPLTTPRGEEDDARRLLEGQALAQALLKAYREVPVADGKAT